MVPEMSAGDIEPDLMIKFLVYYLWVILVV